MSLDPTRPGDTWSDLVTCYDANGKIVAPDSLPVAILLVNGVAMTTTVTVTQVEDNVSGTLTGTPSQPLTGTYVLSATLSGRSNGDVVRGIARAVIAGQSYQFASDATRLVQWSPTTLPNSPVPALTDIQHYSALGPAQTETDADGTTTQINLPAQLVGGAVGRGLRCLDTLEASQITAIFFNSGTGLWQYTVSPAFATFANPNGHSFAAVELVTPIVDANGNARAVDSSGNPLATAANQVDPLASPVPGSYGAGTAGKLLGNLDVPVSSRSTYVGTGADTGTIASRFQNDTKNVVLIGDSIGVRWGGYLPLHWRGNVAGVGIIMDDQGGDAGFDFISQAITGVTFSKSSVSSTITTGGQSPVDGLGPGWYGWALNSGQTISGGTLWYDGNIFIRGTLTFTNENSAFPEDVLQTAIAAGTLRLKVIYLAHPNAPDGMNVVLSTPSGTGYVFSEVTSQNALNCHSATTQIQSATFSFPASASAALNDRPHWAITATSAASRIGAGEQFVLIGFQVFIEGAEGMTFTNISVGGAWTAHYLTTNEYSLPRFFDTQSRYNEMAAAFGWDSAFVSLGANGLAVIDAAEQETDLRSLLSILRTAGIGDVMLVGFFDFPEDGPSYNPVTFYPKFPTTSYPIGPLTWDASAKTLTLSGAFAGYVWGNKDCFRIISGTGTTPGSIVLVSAMNSNDQITVTTNVAASNETDIDGIIVRGWDGLFHTSLLGLHAAMAKISSDTANTGFLDFGASVDRVVYDSVYSDDGIHPEVIVGELFHAARIAELIESAANQLVVGGYAAAETPLLASNVTVANGKVAATIASGDGADAAANKTTLGNSGAGLTAVPYTGPTVVQIDAQLTGTHGSGTWQQGNTAVPLDAVGVRGALGMAAANMDTQIASLATSADQAAIKEKTDQLTFTGSDVNATGAGGGGTISPDDIDAIAAASAAAIAGTINPTIYAPATGGTLDLFRGDSYAAADGRGIVITRIASETYWPTTLTTVDFYCTPTDATLVDDPAAASLGPIPCTIGTATGSGQSFTLELTGAQMLTLQAGLTRTGGYRFWFIANRTTAPATLRSGSMTVRPDPTATA